MRLQIAAAFPILLFLHSSRAVAANVDVCEVLLHPQSLNGEMISIRARVLIDFEDFEIEIPSCPQKVMGRIWLEYGNGPKTQPTTWCCGDLTPRDQAGLIQDDAFRKFDSCLRAFRKGRPLYAVTATLSGRFDTVPATTCPDGIHQCPRDGGFGHLGMFTSRLVIHSVSQISAIRGH